MISISYFRWEYYERDSRVRDSRVEEFTLKFGGGAQSTGLNNCDCEDANADEQRENLNKVRRHI